MTSLTQKLRNLQVPSTTHRDAFTEWTAQKINWNVPEIEHEGFKNIEQGIADTFSRIVALGLELELPVGSFIRAAIEKIRDIPPTAIEGMIGNIEDEEKHFLSFQRIAAKYNVKTEDKKQAALFRREAIQNKLNPIVKTRDLETIVFLPLQGVLRFYGGQSLERLVADISHDEVRHTNYGWLLSTKFKYHRYTDFENFCTRITRWAVQPLQTSKKWEDICIEIRDTGESKILSQMLNYSVHKAPFEINNRTY